VFGQEQELRRVRFDLVAGRLLDEEGGDFVDVVGEAVGRAFGLVVGLHHAFGADVLLEVRAQHVEQRDEHGQLQQQRQAGGQGIDFVLLVELHQPCCWRCLSSL
jgi:hypothetical protein